MLNQILQFKIPIKDLDISGNDVGYKNCKILNQLSQRNRTLRSLKADSSNIQCVGLSYLWLAFNDAEDDLTLDHLSVRDNKINL